MNTLNKISTLLRHTENDEDVIACFDVMHELRPNLTTAQDFLEQVRRMTKHGYRLLVAWENGVPVALAGYRKKEMIIHGDFLYVDDLITKKSKRGRKLGSLLLESIFETARQNNYSKVILDTSISNTLAQRFYFRVGMLPIALHFSCEMSRK